MQVYPAKFVKMKTRKPALVREETHITECMAKLYGFKHQVKTSFGTADLVGKEEVFEFKLHKRHWKAALGQVLAYSLSLKRKPVIAIMDKRDKSIEAFAQELGCEICWFPKGLYGQHICHLPPKLNTNRS